MLGAVIAIAVIALVGKSLLSLRKQKSFLLSEKGSPALYRAVFPTALLILIPPIAANFGFLFSRLSPLTVESDWGLWAVFATNLLYLPGIVVARRGASRFDVNLEAPQRVRSEMQRILFAALTGMMGTLLFPLLGLIAGITFLTVH